MRSVEREQGAAAGPARTTRMWFNAAGHGSTQCGCRTWLNTSPWYILNYPQNMTTTSCTHFAHHLRPWILVQSQKSTPQGERWEVALSLCRYHHECTDNGSDPSRILKCKYKSSLVYSSHNTYYRKWNRLTYILRHEHMYTTFHRNYVYIPFSS